MFALFDNQSDENLLQKYLLVKIAESLYAFQIKYVSEIIPIIEKHHENWDGSGYPNKLAGNDIPLSSQIILIIDAYFALT